MQVTLLSKYWRELTIASLVCAVGFLATRKDRTVVETKIEIQEKIVVKVEERIVYKNRDVVKTRVVTVNKEGEKRVEERTETKQRDINTGIRREETKDTRVTEQQRVVVESAPETYLLGGSWYPRDRTYNLGFHVRLFSNAPIYPGIVVKHQGGRVGFGIGVQVAL